MEQLTKNQKLEITVGTARGSLKLQLPEDTLVKDVVQAVLKEFKLNAQEVYELVHEGVALRPERTLQSYKIQAGESLNLVRETHVG